MKVKAIFLTFALISLTQTALSNYGTSGATCNGRNQIQVSGQGSASSLPDQAVIRISFEEEARTSGLAVDQLAGKVQQLVAALQAQNSTSTYESSSFFIRDDYGNGQVVGKIASQSFIIRVDRIDQKGTQIAALVDALGQINGINLNSIELDIKDKTVLQQKARQAAFQNAKQKAIDYAGFANRTVGKAILIQDETFVQAPAFENERFKVGAAAFSDFSVSTAVPLGDLEVGYRLVVTFQLNI